MATIGLLLVGIGGVAGGWLFLNGAENNYWQIFTTVEDEKPTVKNEEINTNSNVGAIDTVTLQNELASAKIKAEELAAELLREQEKIKANERSRLLAQQKQAAEEEASKLAKLEAESAAKLARERAQRRRITQALDAASKSLDSGLFKDAETYLDTVSSLDSGNERLIQLRARLRAAIQMSRAPVSDREFNSVVSRFDELRRAIQSKDEEKIKRIASASSQNDLFAQLMSRFAKLEVSIYDIKLNNAEKFKTIS